MVTADAIPVEPTDYACIDINSGQRCVNRGGGIIMGDSSFLWTVRVYACIDIDSGSTN